jgi:hypothetical protein
MAYRAGQAARSSAIQLEFMGNSRKSPEATLLETHGVIASAAQSATSRLAALAMSLLSNESSKRRHQAVIEVQHRNERTKKRVMGDFDFEISLQRGNGGAIKGSLVRSPQ